MAVLDHDYWREFSHWPADSPVVLEVEALAAKPEWMADALCIEYRHLDWLPGRGASIDQQRAVCAKCLVVKECFVYSMLELYAQEPGIYAGLTGRDRRRLRADPQRLAEVLALASGTWDRVAVFDAADEHIAGLVRDPARDPSQHLMAPVVHGSMVRAHHAPVLRVG